MKRTTVIATAIAATLSLGGASAALAAQGPLGSAVCGRPYTGTCQTLRDACSGWNFVDADGDGVCDNRGSGNQRLRTPGCRLGHGMGFVDADGDGVCDNRNGQGVGAQRGQGQGLDHGRGHGNGNGGGWGRGNR